MLSVQQLHHAPALPAPRRAHVHWQRHCCNVHPRVIAKSPASNRDGSGWHMQQKIGELSEEVFVLRQQHAEQEATAQELRMGNEALRVALAAQQDQLRAVGAPPGAAPARPGPLPLPSAVLDASSDVGLKYNDACAGGTVEHVLRTDHKCAPPAALSSAAKWRRAREPRVRRRRVQQGLVRDASTTWPLCAGAACSR